MMKGRKPTPTNLRLLHGIRGKRALPKGEPKPEPCYLNPPKDLGPEAKAIWSEMAQPLYEAGILTALDAPALRLLCESHANWRKATEAIAREGMTCTTPSGIERPSPWFRIQASSSELMLRLLSEFGMTPSSRTRVKISEGPPDPDAVDLFGF